MDEQDRILLIEQLDRKLAMFQVLKEIEVPPRGWIYAIRTALNMSLRQLAKRLKITPVSVKEIEEREEHKTITLQKLCKVAEALDLRFVYGFVPKDSTIEKIIENRAYLLAEEIVMRSSHTMKLEDQENSERRLQKAIRDRAALIKREMPKYLWD